MTFGIPVQFVPVSYEGELKTGNHSKWLAKRDARDKAIMRKGTFHGIDLPSSSDVLLGRGKPFQEHPANICLRHLVELHIEEYQMAPIGQKNVIASKIVLATKMGGGRFLKKRKDGWWEEVDDAESTMKVLKTFRTVRALNQSSVVVKSVEKDNKKRVKMMMPEERPCFGVFPCGNGYQ